MNGTPIIRFGPPWREPPPRGKASNYIRHAERKILPGDKVFICCRVSHRTQDHRGNLDDQERNLRREMERLGAIVVGVVRQVGSGWDCSWLAAPADAAAAVGAKLVAESPNRLVRHLDYHPNRNPDAQASEADLRFLRDSTNGVTLVTLVDPDASATEERSYQRKRGQRAKGKKGGRPPKKPPGYKKERREEMLPRVLGLHRQGVSVRRIAEGTGLPKSTVHEWVRR